MNLSVKNGIAEAVNAYMEKHNITQITVSNITRVRKEYISNIVNFNFTYDAGGGKKGNIPDRHFIALAELVDYPYKIKLWKNRQTPQLTQMLHILEESKDTSCTRVVIGVTGCGKSNTIKLYKKRNPYDVFSVVVGSEDTLSGLLDKLAESIGVGVPKQKSGKIREISRYLKRLSNDGRKPQIIFDEGEYMKNSALCSIKEFYDYLDAYCSIVIIGTDQLITQIEKLRNKNAKGIPQLYRRIKFGIRYLEPIDRRYKEFLKDIEDAQVVKWLQDNCANYGELHDVMVPCLREAEEQDVPLSIPLMRQVLNIPINEFNAA